MCSIPTLTAAATTTSSAHDPVSPPSAPYTVTKIAGTTSRWTALPAAKASATATAEEGATATATAEQGAASNNGKEEINIVTTPSTVNSQGEPATLLRPSMSGAYYDAAEQAYQRVETFEFSAEEFAGARHPNARDAVRDFLRVRRDIVQFSRMTAAVAQAQQKLTVGEMLRNGTEAAHSLVRGRKSNVPAVPAPRDPAMAEVYQRLEESIPNDVPMSFFCGFADATLEAQMMLRDLSLERQHTDPLLVAAVSTCSAMYIVVQDRIRARLEKHARGAEEHPEVVEQLDRLKQFQREQ